VPKSKMTMEEILVALYQKAGELAEDEDAAELEQLATRPEFRSVIEVLLEEAKRSDQENTAVVETQEPAVPANSTETTSQTCPERSRRMKGQVPATRSTRTASLAVFYNRSHEGHFSKEYSMESPQRVKSIVSSLRQQPFFTSPHSMLKEAPAATPEDLLSVHDERYLNHIRGYSAAGGGSLPRNTYVTKGSWDAVLGSAGCALSAGEAVQGTTDFAFALTRPPGHHAWRDAYGGFCLFNNAAILASSRFMDARVMILNLDAHASDGTKRIFYNDPRVLTVSIHQDPSGLFPREGWTHEIGAERGSGYAVNVPLLPESGDPEYLRVFDSVVAPLHDQFKPDFLIVECGFDAHHLDPLTNLALTRDGYHALGVRLRSLRDRRMVLTLEGGYDTHSIGPLACSFVAGLLAEPNPFPEEPAKPIAGKADPLSYSLTGGPKADDRAPRAPSMITSAAEDVIQRLRSDLGRWWKL